MRTIAVMAAALAVSMTPVAAASPGQSSGDFNKDGFHDIVATGGGELKVYLHSGEYQGAHTYQPPEVVGHGWSTMRWVGQGKLTRLAWEEGWVDVIAVDAAGRLLLYPNSRCGLCGTRTFEGPYVIDDNWQANDLITVADVNDDRWDDLVGRRAGDMYLYRNGPAGFQEPELLASGRERDVVEGIADVTLDGRRDLVFVRDDGVLGAYSFADGKTYVLGFGWRTINAVVFAEVDGNRGVDILGRRASDGALLAYTHTGAWAPQPDGTALTTFTAPRVVGYNWHINNHIT